MRVSTRLLVVLCLVTSAFLGALAVLRHWQQRNIVAMLEERQASAHRFANRTIELQGKPLLAYSEDYSFWDEMADFVQTGDRLWAEENLPTSLKTFDADVVWVYRPDGTRVYSGTRPASGDLGEPLPVPGGAEALFSKDRFAHFFFEGPAGLTEVRGATIHRTSDPERKAPAAGYLFMGRLWGREQLDRLSALLDSTCSLAPAAGQIPATPPDAFRTGEIVVRHPLRGWNGTPLALLEIRSSSPMIARYAADSNWDLMVAGVFSLLLLCLFASLLIRWIATPLRMISTSLATGDPGALGRLERSRSEYGTIARLVTAHFAQSASLVREMAERRRLEEAHAFLLQCGHTPSGGDFFSSLAAYLADTLELDFVCIDRLLADGLTAQTVAVYFDGKFEDNISYALKDTPCGDVVGKTICCFPRDVRGLFPNDAVLQEMHAESYVGTTLWSADGRPIGLIAVIGRKPLSDPGFSEAILKLVAVRAAGELERTAAEAALLESRQQLQIFLESGFDSFFLMRNVRDASGRIDDFEIVEVSFRGAQLVSRTREQLIGRRLCELFPFHKTEGFFEKYREVAETGRSLEEEIRVPAHPQNGVNQEMWLHHHVVPVNDGIAIASSVVTERRQAEEALRENREWLAMAQSAGHIGFFDWDMMTGETRWSPELERILGLPSNGSTARYGEWSRRVHPEDLPRIESVMARHAASGPDEIDFEYRLLRDDGERWIAVSGRILRDPDGRAVRVIGTNIDTTDRKHAEDALRHRENLLQKVFDILPVGLWFADGRGNLLRGNPAGQRIWGGEPLVGQEQFGIFRARRMPSGEEVAPDDWALAHTVNEGVTIADEELEIETLDGGTKTILNYSAPVLDDQGRVEAAVVVNLDITERKRAQQRLVASETRYRRLFESAKDGILILDATTGQIVDVNPYLAELLGFPAPSLLGKRLWELGLFKDVAASEEAFRKLQERGYIRYEDLPLETRDGRQIEVEFVSNVYPVGDGTVIQCNIRDISERKRLEDQLRQAQKMDAVGQLAGGVAHDFNNLLQVILGNVGLVQRMQAPGSPSWEEVEEVRKAAERAAELTQQLLAFSRRQTIQPVHADLNELVQGVLKMLRRLIGEQIELSFIPGGALEKVYVDRGQIEQVLMNLSVNARDAMPHGGKLTIRTENAVLDAAFCRDNPGAAEGRHALITVTDTGRGMDAATRARVFEPFFTTKEFGQGTGLGLATVYGIVKQHNGVIRVDSTPQKGTVFSVYLPAAAQHAEDAAQNGRRPPVWGGSETILVAEDEPAVLNLIATLLRTVGYNVLTACDGLDALRVFEEHARTIDLAVLDMVMPGLSGRETMDRIKAINPDMRFLFSSGYNPSSIHKDFVIEEGLHLIRKPYRREDFLRRVRQILDERREEAPQGQGPEPV